MKFSPRHMRLVHRFPRYRPSAGLAISLGLGLSSGVVAAAADAPEQILQRIGDKVAEHLSFLPNYTCHEAINRLIRPVNSGVLSQSDRVELEVAFIGQQELFANLGDSHIGERTITNLVPTGVIGDSLFGNHVQAIFLGDIASFDYLGIFKQDGRKLFRYDFQVPLKKSNFLVRHNDVESRIAYQGSLWADFDTFDLVRLDITANQIPSYIGIGIIKERAEYTSVRFRNVDFLLPLHAKIEVSDSSGNFSLNEVTLEQCREFTGESRVLFGTSTDPPPADRKRSEQ